MKVPKTLFICSIFQILFFYGCAQEKNTMEKGKPTAKNRLAKAKSPYLQQHADNPVDWYEWGEEALEKAKKENKPLLISIGYAACHWCHVMERESFMDSTIAQLMNTHFVPIKIDREERPDIDQIYMNAVQLLTGSGGWPLNAFALPDGQPFFAGTYFPVDQWKKVLEEIHKVYTEKQDKVEAQAAQLTKGIKEQEVISLPAQSDAKFTKNTYRAIFSKMSKTIDYKKGGYQRSPKFPMPVGWEFLLQYHYLLNEAKALDAVNVTLTAMANGGIYDQIGGGFSRYSVDEVWFAPHFEKMLYDNGQLVSLYAHAYKVTGDETYAQVIRETLAFIEREMTSAEGGFYASLNADSEGVEGKFYVWTNAEIDALLPSKTAAFFKTYYNITPNGNWENNQNILHKKMTMSQFATEHNLTVSQWEQMLNEGKTILLKARDKRVRPSTDDKVLTSWNALMLKGYVDAYLALGDTAYLNAALKNAQFIAQNMIREEGRLWRNYKDGEAGIEAFLDDYALLADAYILLYQATLDVQWLQLARTVSEYAIAHFREPENGLFYYTSDVSEALAVRKMELADNVIPASNSVMAQVLYRLGEYFYHQPYIDMATAMLNQVQKDMVNQGGYYANWGLLMGLMAHTANEVAVMGNDALPVALELQKKYLPTSLFMGGSEENLPLLEYKLAPEETMIYVCQNKICKLPVREVSKALQQLGK
ncbi:thioredoxin domain-containing protein [Arenibacter sp. GZD96]|uniref:thioredoxin domain-containing protein n=1 Tax=Aurantibrevibacter litoralis TaxID=3106030 RepID=UPI002AFF6D32|nr:thioredoxin domain-containing protein [Arenibacter sp. GZD-96]MEA1784750.1 thioredoxin domain-containing protein [Arenibacter sp. GZD-96]